MNTQVVNGNVVHPAVAATQETTSPSCTVTISMSELTALQAERDQYQTKVQELEAAAEAEAQRWARILVKANEWADHHDLCERYDEFLEAQGLPTRVCDYDVTVTVELRVALRASGRNIDAAASEINYDSIAEYLADQSREELYGSMIDFTVDSAELV